MPMNKSAKEDTLESNQKGRNGQKNLMPESEFCLKSKKKTGKKLCKLLRRSFRLLKEKNFSNWKKDI